MKNQISKAVVLVDIDPCISQALLGNTEYAHILEIVKAASLRCLLVLLQQTGTKGQLEWGHYIVTQNSDHQLRQLVLKRVKLKEFSMDSFQEFEENLLITTRTEVIKSHESDPLNPRSKQLRIAISNVILDLPWVPPFMSSPIKGKKTNIETYEKSRFMNHIFLFTFCPRNHNDLQRFFLHNVGRTSSGIECDITFEDMLPRKLQDSISNESKVKIHMFDLTPALGVQKSTEICPRDGIAYEMFKTGLSKIDGQILPVNVLFSSSSNSTRLASILQNDCRDGELVNIGTISLTKQILSYGPSYLKTSENQSATLLIHKAEGAIQVLRVRLSCVESRKGLDEETSNEPNDSRLDIRTDSYENVDDMICGSTKLPSDRPDLQSAVCFEVIGNILQENELVSNLFQEYSHSYFLSSVAGDDLHEFKSLMNKSMDKKTVLMLDVKVNDRQTCFAILQPSSTPSASLRFISPKSSDYLTDKLFLSALTSEPLFEEQGNHLDEFIKRSVVHMAKENEKDGSSDNEHYKEDDKRIVSRDKTSSTCDLRENSLSKKTRQNRKSSRQSDENRMDDSELELLKKLYKKYKAQKSTRLSGGSRERSGDRTDKSSKESQRMAGSRRERSMNSAEKSSNDSLRMKESRRERSRNRTENTSEESLRMNDSSRKRSRSRTDRSPRESIHMVDRGRKRSSSRTDKSLRTPVPIKDSSNKRLVTSPRKVLTAVRKTTATPLRRSPRKKCTAVSKDSTPIILPPRNPVKKSRSFTAPTRTDHLWQTYRKQLKRTDSSKLLAHKGQGDDGSTPAVPENEKCMTPCMDDINTEEELLKFLTSFYANVIGNDEDISRAAQTLVKTCLHYFKRKKVPESEKKSRETMAQFLTDSRTVKEKHETIDDKKALFREYELQVILHTEMEALIDVEQTEDEIEKKVTQVAGILRAMSFMRDPEFVARYMKTIMLQNYVETAPMFLTKIYDELLLPLPPQLDTPLSPNDLLNSVKKPSRPSLTSSQNSANASSLSQSNQGIREKAINRYRSFHAVSTRQIAIPSLAVAKSKKPKSDKPRRTSARTASSLKKSAKKRAQAAKMADSKKVRKNLFGDGAGDDGNSRKTTKLERRQSCMASIQSHSRKQSKTPKGHHASKSRRVAETPAHKQRGNVLWRRQEKERQRTRTVDVDINVVAESPDKQLSKEFLKKTPEKAHSKLSKQRSFYSENITKAEKLEARMINSKVLSPTWNAPKFGSLLAKTPPRRIAPRMLFKSLDSPSPNKQPSGNIPQSSNMNADEPFKLGKAVAALNFLQSPCKNTRSQQSNLKAFTDFAGDKFGRIFTPRGKDILKTPVKGDEKVPSTPTPTKKLNFMSSSGRQRLDSESTNSVGRRVSFSTMLLTPQKEIRQPCNPFQSPSKSILTPTKYAMPKPRNFMQSPLRQQAMLRKTPGKNPSPQQKFQSPRRGKVSNTPVIRTLSSGLDSSSSDNSVEHSPRITRSASKLQKSTAFSASPDANVRTNLDGLFEANNGGNYTLDNGQARNIDIRSNISQNIAGYSDKENAEGFEQYSENSVSVKRRTLRSRQRSSQLDNMSPTKSKTVVRRLDSSAVQSDSSQLMPSRGKKRKDVEETGEKSMSSRKRSRSHISIESINSLQSLMDVSISNHNDVFMEEAEVSFSRNREEKTRSNLISDNSNSAMSFADFTELTHMNTEEIHQVLPNSKSFSTISQMSKPRTYSILDTVDNEDSKSPIFMSSVHKPGGLPARLLSVEMNSDSSVPTSPIIQPQRTASPLLVEVCTNAHISNVTSSETTPSRSTRSASVSSASKKTKSFSPNTMKLQSPSTARLQKSPSAANIYSPLSTKGLVQLIESPILDGTSNSAKTSSKVQENTSENMSDHFSEEAIKENQTTSGISPIHKRPARRSLYRSQTKADLSK